MKFAPVPGTTPAFGLESIDLMLLALAVPAALGLFIVTCPPKSPSL